MESVRPVAEISADTSFNSLRRIIYIMYDIPLIAPIAISGQGQALKRFCSYLNKQLIIIRGAKVFILSQIW